MLHKDFIGESRFNNLISPFRELIEKKGWSLLCEHKPAGFAAIVKESYANMWGRRKGYAMTEDNGSSSS